MKKHHDICNGSSDAYCNDSSNKFWSRHFRIPRFFALGSYTPKLSKTNVDGLEWRAAGMSPHSVIFCFYCCGDSHVFLDPWKPPPKQSLKPHGVPAWCLLTIISAWLQMQHWWKSELVKNTSASRASQCTAHFHPPSPGQGIGRVSDGSRILTMETIGMESVYIYIVYMLYDIM